MKKPRQHTAKRKARGAQKRARLQAMQVAAVTAKPAHIAHPKRAADAWRWHDTATGPAGHNSGGKQRRAKGPPPPKPARKPALVTTPVTTKSKLSPALAARLAAPLPAPIAARPVWQMAQQRLASAWRADRMAAVLLLMPTLLTAAFLATLPRAKAPLERTPLVASLKLKPHPTLAPPTVVADVETPAFTRPPERITPAHTWAEHDLASVALALSRDIADLAPPFRRPSEALAPSVPMAQHDLASIASALARDVDALRAPFVRPPEGLVETLVTLALETAKPPATAGVSADRPMMASLPPQTSPQPTEPAATTETAAAPTCRAPAALLEARSTKRTSATALLSPLPPLNPDAALAGDPLRFGLALSAAAKAQTQDLVVYNARYMQIAYPRGDVPALFGVCTDVVIRAYRALDIDLQELVHQSRAGAADTSIDHRRTDLLRKFFATHGEQLAVSPYSEDYLPGDIVTYYRPQNKSSTAHIAVVTDEIAPSGRPMIAHNRGWGVQLEDALFVDQITGHYRFRGLDASAVAALPRNVVMAAAIASKRPVVRVADAARGSLAAKPAAASADGESAALLVPPMGLGALSPSAVSRTAQARCPATSKTTGAACRPNSGQTPLQP